MRNEIWNEAENSLDENLEELDPETFSEEVAFEKDGYSASVRKHQKSGRIRAKRLKQAKGHYNDAYFIADKPRRHNSKRPRIERNAHSRGRNSSYAYLKRMCNKRLRRFIKDDTNYGHNGYRKVTDLWWLYE